MKQAQKAYSQSCHPSKIRCSLYFLQITPHSEGFSSLGSWWLKGWNHCLSLSLSGKGWQWLVIHASQLAGSSVLVCWLLFSKCPHLCILFFYTLFINKSECAVCLVMTLRWMISIISTMPCHKYFKVKVWFIHIVLWALHIHMLPERMRERT